MQPPWIPIRVLLVDDHRLILQALSRLLDDEPDIRVVGLASSIAEAAAHAGEPMDVALVDYRLRDGTGADAARAIKARWPAARIVMLTAVEDDEAVYDSIRAGADGYLTMDQAVERSSAPSGPRRTGATLLPRPMIMMIARRLAETRDREADRFPSEAMTPRELEVLRALAEGMGTPEICAALSISPNTSAPRAEHHGQAARALQAGGRGRRPPARDRGAPARGLTGPRRPRISASRSAPRAGCAPAGSPGPASAVDGPAPLVPSLALAPLPGIRGRSRIVGRVETALRLAAIELPPLGGQGRPAAGAPPLLGEQGVQRGHGVDLAATGAAG